LTPNAVAVQIPIGERGEFSGVVDLLKMKAYTFSGRWVRLSLKEKFPAELLDKAKEWREKMVEKISETDDTLTGKYLGGEEITIEE